MVVFVHLQFVEFHNIFIGWARAFPIFRLLIPNQYHCHMPYDDFAR